VEFSAGKQQGGY